MALSTHISLALDHAAMYDACIIKARKDSKDMTHDQVRAVILPIVASKPKYAVPLIDGKGKAQGTKVLDSTHANYENAKRAVTRLLTDIKGVQSSGKKEAVALPKGIVRNIANEIIDAGLTKAQFNELLAQLRDAVSFQ
jgi:hypothetical protein|tara:strand:- start:85 stop:501 length:417 start_codon:yes stop_codon:yes gene_type:complete